MGIYVKVVKQAETNESVTYAYGAYPEHLDGVIEITLPDLLWCIVKEAKYAGKVLALAIIPRIIRDFRENGSFPEVKYKQS